MPHTTDEELLANPSYKIYYKDCNPDNFVKSECVLVGLNKSEWFNIVPRKKIDGYVKYIIWDQNKKKFIGKLNK